MVPVGFSTGSLAQGNFRHGLQMVAGHATRAIELSALREHELRMLVSDIAELDLSEFTYVSVHLPGRLETLSEADVVEMSLRMRAIRSEISAFIIHPDIIQDWVQWRRLGALACIENMDKRKSVGRTVAELKQVFTELPTAGFCFDVGHASQVDPSLVEAYRMLQQFGNRLRQLHLSYVNTMSKHERLGLQATIIFRPVFELLRSCVPVILESPVTADEIQDEISTAMRLMQASNFIVDPSSM